MPTPLATGTLHTAVFFREGFHYEHNRHGEWPDLCA
jgi:hypothetical protein